MEGYDIDDIVEEWHFNYTGPLGLKEYMMDRTGWTSDQWEDWCREGGIEIVDF